MKVLLAARHVSAVDFNMGTMLAESRTGDANTFPFSLLDSVTTCLYHDSDKLCFPIALSCVSALLSLLSCVLLMYQRCTVRPEHPGETTTFLYSLLGNVCGTVGAVMSRQLHIQVLMGVSAAVADIVSFVSCCVRVLLCWNSKAEKRLRMMRGRRRQHILAVCMLMVVAGGLLKSKASHLPADQPPSGRRRLLHVTLQDNTEILGYVLGLLAFIIACTSRFPALLRAYKGQKLTRAYVISGLLCSLAAALYAAAILLYDTQFDFLLKVMPWLLSAICCVILELLIVVIRWWRSGTRQKVTIFPPDTKSLLASGVSSEKNCAMKRQSKQQVHSSIWTKAEHVQKMSEMGHYMDVSVHPAGKVCLRELMSKEKVEDQPLNSMLQLIGVDSFCTSNTSCDSSVVSSDLEWDFEEANPQWRETTAKPQEEANLCSCAMFGLPQRTLSGTKEGLLGHILYFACRPWLSGLDWEKAEEQISTRLDGQGYSILSIILQTSVHLLLLWDFR